MAPKAASAPSVPDEVHRYASQVYEACLPIFKENPRYAFNQMAIQDLDIVPDDSDSAAVLLLSVLNYLVARKLFKVVTDADGVAWRLRTEEDAKQ